MVERTALEISVVRIRTQRDCLSRERRESKQKQRKRIKNITTWSSKSAILLVYLMTLIELTHFITHFSAAAHKM